MGIINIIKLSLYRKMLKNEMEKIGYHVSREFSKNIFESVQTSKNSPAIEIKIYSESEAIDGYQYISNIESIIYNERNPIESSEHIKSFWKSRIDHCDRDTLELKKILEEKTNEYDIKIYKTRYMYSLLINFNDRKIGIFTISFIMLYNNDLKVYKTYSSLNNNFYDYFLDFIENDFNENKDKPF